MSYYSNLEYSAILTLQQPTSTSCHLLINSGWSGEHTGRVTGGITGLCEPICKALSFHQHWLFVAHGTQFVPHLRGSHPDDEVPALPGGDGKGSMHVLAPMKEALSHPMFHL